MLAVGRLVREGAREEDYLAAIYRLQEFFGIARTSMIAKEVGVKPGTVTRTLYGLVARGLVEYDRYRGVMLTEAGREVAARVVYAQRVFEVFLNRVLGFDLLSSYALSKRASGLPEEVLRRLDEFLGRPQACPHGLPVPGRGGGNGGIVLRSFKPGRCAEVVSLGGEIAAFAGFFHRHGVSVGSRFRVEYVGSGHVEVRALGGGGSRLQIPSTIATTIIVRPVRTC